MHARTTRRQQLINRYSLSYGTGKPIHDYAALGIGRSQLLFDDPENHLIRYQFPLLHIRLSLLSQRRPGLDGGAQHVAGRDLRHAELARENFALCSLTSPRSSQQHDVHVGTLRL